MSSAQNHRERLFDLLADDAVMTLSDAERAELETLLDAFPDVDPEETALAAAAIHLESIETRGDSFEPLPDLLAARIRRDAGGFFAAGDSADGADAAPSAQDEWSLRRDRRSATMVAAAGWFAAAAAWLFAFQPATDVSELDRPPVERVLTARELHASLTGDADDSLVLAWTATEDVSAGALVTGAGDVVWNDRTQTGVMRFDGLAANDPSVEQYQLWIFDASRSDAHPVDGGVFDVPSDGGEVYVAIDPKLPVDRAVMFAVTVERPGGVVVSDRERIAVLAKREA